MDFLIAHGSVDVATVEAGSAVEALAIFLEELDPDKWGFTARRLRKEHAAGLARHSHPARKLQFRKTPWGIGNPEDAEFYSRPA